MEEKEFRNESLVIRMRVGDEGVELIWSGKNTDMNAGKFIGPILSEALDEGDNGAKPVTLDFQKLEFMNSSTISQLIIMLNQARDNNHRVSLVYKESSKWQRFSFNALDVFKTEDQRIDIRGV